MLEVPNRVRVLIIVVAVAVLVGLSVLIAFSVKNNLYDIAEITEGIDTEEASSYSESTIVREDYSDSVIEYIYGMEQGDIPDSEYAVLRALAVLSSSPMSKDVEQATYEAKHYKGEWIIKFTCVGCDLAVICDDVVFSPYMYTCTRMFSSDEVAYFESLGKAWSVENEDGTYSIYFT